MYHRTNSVLRLVLLIIILTGMFGQPQTHVLAAATNINTITIPSIPAGGAALGYVAGEVVTVRVIFTAAETVTGTPSIMLNVGGNLRKANYVSGSGTTSLDFAYTVVAGDVDANGISIPANTLVLNGGSINNGTDAAQITHALVADQVADIIAASVAALDTTAPVLRSAVGAGSTITLFYDELGSGLRATPLPPSADFTFSRNGGVGPQLTVTSVSINHSANTVTVGLNGLINTADTNMRVGYTATGTNDVQDVAGNKIANFSNLFVANTMPSFDVKGNTLSFDNPFSITGDGRTAGNRVLFSNIITVDGQSIDAIVTTTALNGASLTGFDTLSGTATPVLTTTPAAVDALWFKLNTNIGGTGGDATITFDFIKSGSYNAANLTATKGDDVILQNVVINSYDLDGAGGDVDNYQYQEFGGFATYTVANNSDLTQTQVGALTHFQTTTGGNITDSPGTDMGDQIRVMALYEAIHQFQIKTGSIATGGTAYYYLDFSKGANWFNPTLTYEIPTVNPKVTNDTTPDLTGTFVGAAFTSGIPSATVQAYTLRVTVNGKTYSAGEVAGERTTLGNGDIQLLDATTGLTGVFNPMTGVGTWTLTIPPADALPLATYNVGVDVGYGTSLGTINKHTLDDTTNELVINGTPPDTTAPTFTSITRGNPVGEFITSAALAVQNHVDFTVTFSEAVTNVELTDFQITGAGSTGSTISSVTQTGPTTYTVRVASIPTTNTGILDLNLLATSDVVDLAGNLLTKTIDPVEGLNPTSGIDETYLITSLADLVVTKTDGVASLNEGSVPTYTIRATNNGTSSVTGATLADTVGAGLSATGVSCSAAAGNQCITDPSLAALTGVGVSLPALASGQFYEITLSANVTVTSGSVTNSVTVTPPAGTMNPGTSCVSGGGITRSFDAATGACMSTDTDAVVNLPDAVDDTATTNEGTPVTTSMLTNDNLGTEPTTITSNSQGSNGTVICTATECTYTPNTDFSGLDSYTYTITDANGITDAATVTITVVNLPDAINDSDTTDESTPVTTAVLTNDDLGFTPTTITSNSQGSNGIVTCTASDCVYTPDPGFSGTDSYTYTITDSNDKTDTARVTIIVVDLPNAIDDTETTDEGTPVTTAVLANDDLGSTPTSITSNSQGVSGSVDCTATNCTYTPDPGFSGSDSYTYIITDSNGNSSTGTVIVTVTNLPNAVDDTAMTNEGTPVTTNVLTNDDLGITPTTITANTPGADGTVSCTSTECTYTPDAGFNGTDTYNYTITDSNGNSSTATVTVIVDQALLGISKRVVSTTQVSPGTWDVTYGFYVENYGTVEIGLLQVVDDLSVTFPLPTTFTVRSIASTQFTENTAYNGSADTSLLAGDDSLAPGDNGTIMLVVRIVPSSGGPFENVATVSGMDPNEETVTDDSQDGTDPDQDGDGDPTNDNDPTSISFGPNLFDPPFGVKSFDASGLPVLKWTMIWINNSNLVAVHAQVSDPIVSGTTYAGGLTCTVSGVSTTTLCTFEPSSVTYPQGRVLWNGSIGPDLGATDAASAANEVTISFNVTVNSGTISAQNVATIDSDRNGDNDFADQGELQAASASRTWNGPSQPSKKSNQLPATGFAANMVTDLSHVPHENYQATGDITLEIPSLRVKIPVVGVPKKNGTWNIAWLGDQAGWLEGSAFPSWNGNSILTGHVYLASGLPGPFVSLNKLKYGDRIVVHAYGQKYTFAVQTNTVVDASDSTVMKHEEKPWLTLVTCKDYDEKTDSYRNRVVVRAVLVRVDFE